MNKDRTGNNCDTPTAREGSRPVRKDRHEKRRKREAKALAIVKAIRPKKFLEPDYTKIVGDHPNPTGVVYFVYCADCIKIGFTTDISNRMAGLATNSPFP